jgi:hypothetical protein
LDFIDCGIVVFVVGNTIAATTVVIVELTTAIPANAELRRYSLVTGWANFEVDAS